jgi:hypothetical protein
MHDCGVKETKVLEPSGVVELKFKGIPFEQGARIPDVVSACARMRFSLHPDVSPAYCISDTHYDLSRRKEVIADIDLVYGGQTRWC